MLETRSRVLKHSKTWGWRDRHCLALCIMLRNLDFFPKSVQNDLSFTQWSGMIRYHRKIKYTGKKMYKWIELWKTPGKIPFVEPETPVTGLSYFFLPVRTDGFERLR